MLCKLKKEAVPGLPSVFRNGTASRRKEESLHEAEIQIYLKNTTYHKKGRC